MRIKPNSTSLKTRRVFQHLLTCVTTTGVALAMALTLEAAPPELKTSGNKIVIKATNVPIRLTGVATPSLEWNVNGENLANSIPYAISDWHAKIIRLPVSQASWLSATNGPAYKTRIDGFIQLASDAGAYVILDLHQYGQPNANSATFWTDASNRYKNNPAVLFGLYNEPHDISWEVWRNGDVNGPGIQTLLNTVRATGANNIVLAGGLDYAYDLRGIITGYALTDTTGNGIVYDIHFYPWKGGWQEKVGNVAQQYPILAGEFGHPGGTTFIGLTFETDSTWVPKAMDWIDIHNISWTGWSFHPGAAPRMISDWNYAPTPYWGIHALQRLQSYPNPSSDKIAGGTVIGTPGTRTDPSSGVITNALSGAVAPYNGGYSTYFDAATPSGGWTGLDLGTAKRITKIRFMPRPNFGSLMVGGTFQGSNTYTFSTYTDLHTITTAPIATGGVYTSVPVTVTTAFRYVRYVGPAGSYCNIAELLFYTGDGIGNVTPVDDTIVDNGFVPGIVKVGNWTGSTAAPGYIGGNYWHDQNTGQGTKSMRYTPNLPAASYYEVFARWPSGTGQATNVPIDIIHAEGIDRVTVDQSTGGGQWVSLGLYKFNAGTSGSVLVSNAGTDGFVIADAFRFVKKTNIIMDNTDASGITITGTWSTPNTPAGFLGSNFLHDQNAGKGTKSVRYTPTIPITGDYEVFACWSGGPVRAGNVPIDIVHADGTTPVQVDQRSNNGVWMPLGIYHFTAGTTGSVVIKNDGTTASVTADGVRFFLQ